MIAVDIFMSPTGDDITGNGKLATPFKTFDKCAQFDVGVLPRNIRMLPGTYLVGTHFSVHQTFWLNNTSLIGAGAAILDGGGGEFFATAGDPDYELAVSGLSLTNINNATGSKGLFNLLSGEHWTISSCIFDHIILSDGFACVFFFENDAGGPLSLDVKGCRFTNIDGGGTQIVNHNSDRNTLCRFSNCTVYLHQADGHAPKFFHVNDGGTKLSLMNNILWCDTTSPPVFNDGASDYFGPDQTSPTSFCNLVRGWADDPLSSGIGHLTSDPLFVDADRGNFNLMYDSPCRFAGSVDANRLSVPSP